MGRLFAACFLCSFLFVLSACGQRGPLYLPEDKPSANEIQEEARTNEEEDGEEMSGS